MRFRGAPDSSSNLNSLVTSRARGLARTAHIIKIPWIIHFFLQKTAAGDRTSDPLRGRRTLYHWTTKIFVINTKKLCTFELLIQKCQIAKIFCRIKVKVFLYIVHITKYTFEVIWGAVAPNNSSCVYLLSPFWLTFLIVHAWNANL